MTQKELCARALLTRTTAGRIYRNKNDKGGEYTPSVEIFAILCIALKLTVNEKNALLKIAYPALDYLDEILEKGLSVEDAISFYKSKGVKLPDSIESLDESDNAKQP